MKKNNKYYKEVCHWYKKGGTALAEVISRHGNKVNLWAREDNG